jgi:hypothetical protein
MTLATDDHEKTAQAIERTYPGWMVVFGYFTHQYVALPLFAAPDGIIVAAAYPPAVITRIQQAERYIFAQSLRLPGSRPASVPPHAPTTRTRVGTTGAGARDRALRRSTPGMGTQLRERR